ncbi:hypothetical protein Q3G72_001765 [Acer saccharum]|nr:hypothetical protein Q3G72_001765 [Acer saccharum]
MACNIVSISINFSAPLCCCVPQTSLKKMCSEKSALGRLSHKASVVTATNFPAPCSSNSNRGLFSVSRSCHCHLTATCKRCDEIVNCSFDVAICNNVAFAYPKLLQLTWMSHDPLAFCPKNGCTK